MTYSTKWLQLCEAEQAYRQCQSEVMQDKEQLALDLEKALVEDNRRALRLLAALQPSFDTITPFLARVLDLAIDSSSPDSIGLAWEVLSPYKEDIRLKNHLQPLLARYLAQPDEWHYRRIAELYIQLNYKEELATFLVRCRASDNVEIQEISDDFRPL